MRLLYVLLFVCLAALLWAWFGVMTHVRRHKKRLEQPQTAAAKLEGR